MLSEQEALERIRANDIPVDPLLLRRWIKQRKLAVIRKGEDGWQISQEAVSQFITNWFLEANEQLRREIQILTEKNEELKEKIKELDPHS